MVTTKTTKEAHKTAIERDAKHILEELWDFESDESFYKMFMRDTKGEHGVC